MSETHPANQVVEESFAELQKMFERKSAEIEDRYLPRIQQLTGDIEEDSPNKFEAAVKLKFKVEWVMKGIKLDLPVFNSRRESIKFDVPEVKMVMEEIKFDTPDIRMKRVCLFKKPEFHFPKIKWTCVYGNKPEPYMRRQVIKTKIPQIYSKRIEIKFDIPEVRMETRELKTKIPQFKLVDWEAEIKEKQERLLVLSAKMEGEFNSLSKEFQIEAAKIMKQTEMVARTSPIEESAEGRNTLSDTYETTIATLKDAISELRKTGATDRALELEGRLATITTEYQEHLEGVDKKLEEAEVRENDMPV